MKVFWSEVAVAPVETGLEIRLDGRPVRTPGRQPMVLPNAEFAEVVAQEWRSQTNVVDPLSMPATRMANSAIEKVGPNIDAVADH
ncbi:MAG: ATP12 family protein, partial [Pseudomonadota bacterium]